MKAYYDRLTNITWSASAEDSGYPAARAGKLPVRWSYRTPDDTSGETLTGTFDVATNVEGVIIQGINAGSIDVSLDGGAATTYVPQVDGINRWRIHIPIGSSITTIAITLNGSPQDGAAYFEVGTVHPFGSVVDLPVTWDYGLSAQAVVGRKRTEMGNRRAHSVEIGMPFLRYTGRIDQEDDEDSEQFIRLAQGEIVGMFFEVGPNREEAVPVRFNEEQYTRSYPSYNRRVVDVTIEESVA